MSYADAPTAERELLRRRKLQKTGPGLADRPRALCALLAMIVLLPVATFANVPACHLVGTVTTLHSFSGTDGAGVYGPLVQGTDGNFYGAASSGGVSNSGTIFKITPTGVFTTLFQFNGSNYADPNDGLYPNGGLVQGHDGAFYGTTVFGGEGNEGTVFRITADGVLTTLNTLDWTHANPSHLILGSDGAFYGTSETDGQLGNVFKITPTLGWVVLHGVRVLWTFYPATTVHLFNGQDGAFPGAGVIQGSDGNFYGTTEFGSLQNSTRNGTVFEVTPSGELTTLYTFNVPANVPDTPDYGPRFKDLIQGRDGAFYGTTPWDNGLGSFGPSGNGMVFKITPTQGWEYVNGVWRPVMSYPETTLHAFNGADGSSPRGLIQGTDGNFYGGTWFGGPSGDGTLFLITSAGAMTTLYSFSGIDGGNPTSLIQGADGNFYGTTLSGGAHNQGTVFQLSVSLQCHSVP